MRAIRRAFGSVLLTTGRRRATPLLVGLGTASVLAGLVVIWAARLSVPYAVYVSELGAAGARTAVPFEAALLCVAFGGFAVAAAAGHVRSAVPVLGYWLPALTLVFAAACFVTASQVRCTATCPVPFVDPRSTAQDFVHTIFAVFGFAAACYAMLQVAVSRQRPGLAQFSLASCVAVAVITAAGGVLALVRVGVVFGSWLEFAGMTVAIVWLAVYGLALGVELRLDTDVDASQSVDASLTVGAPQTVGAPLAVDAHPGTSHRRETASDRLSEPA